ncbi:MAG TPA: hypothetical protein VN238_22140 [Solirubrobacteraceae bacterium]|nr:hypothetical protein [Solirubrobacteraceae bacterium]
MSDTYRGESDVLGEIGEVEETPEQEAAPQQEAAAPAPAATPAAAPQVAASESLPFTGSDAAIVGAGGLLLLASGFGLRRLAQ